MSILAIRFQDCSLYLLNNVERELEKDSLGERIRCAREALLMSQEQLAEIISVDPETVSRWERGVRFPHRNKINKLAETLYLSPESLLLGASTTKQNEPSPYVALAVLRKIVDGASEVERLRTELAEAKAENQRLRDRLAAPPEGAPPPALPRDPVPADAGARVSEGLYDRGRRKRAGAKKKSGQR